MKPSPPLYPKAPRPHPTLEPTLLWICSAYTWPLISALVLIPNSLAPDPGCLWIIPETLQGTEWRISWKKPWHPAFLLPLGCEKDLGQEPMLCPRKREVTGTEGSQSWQIQTQWRPLHVTEPVYEASQRTLPTGACAHTGGTEVLTFSSLGWVVPSWTATGSGPHLPLGRHP